MTKGTYFLFLNEMWPYIQNVNDYKVENPFEY